MHIPSSTVRSVLRLLPVAVPIAGRKRTLIMTGLDAVIGGRQGPEAMKLGGATIRLDLRHTNERLLGYCFFNVLRFYRNSALFRYMQGMQIRRGEYFFDIGANLGLYSLLARSRGLEPVLYEPEQRHFAFLERNASVLGRAYNIALSDTTGVATLFLADDSNPGSHSLVRSNDAQPQIVQVRRLDEHVQETGVDAALIRLVKIDVEGNEYRTVRGLDGILENPDVTAEIWCEVRGPASRRAPNTVEPVCAHLETFGYEAYTAGPAGPVRFDAGSQMPAVFDLLFRRSGR